MVEIILFFVSIVILISISAFFSGSETALTAASKPRVHSIAKSARDGKREKARAIETLWSESEATIGAILFGNNLVNILASSLATSLFIRLFGGSGVLYATIVMTFLVVLFAEVFPKTLALRQPDEIAMAIIKPLRIITACIRPLSDLIQRTVSLLTLPFGRKLGSADKEQTAEETLLGAIDLHSSEMAETSGEENLEARRMMRSILDLDDVVVGEIMTHRKNIETIDADLPARELVSQVMESPFTRLPLWQGNPDNIIGVLHAKELLRAISKARIEDIKFDEITKKPWFVPENTVLFDQLSHFKNRHEHFALVVDEYGSLEGIVTLEDILEEIVGEISDEQDAPVEGVFPQGDGSFVVEGTVTIRDLNRRFDWQLPDEQASTIAGLVLYESGEIPKVGQVFDFHGFRIKILKKHRHQITSLSLRQLDHDL